MVKFSELSPSRKTTSHLQVTVFESPVLVLKVGGDFCRKHLLNILYYFSQYCHAIR